MKMMIGLLPVSDASIVGRLAVLAQNIKLPSGLVVDEVSIEGQDVNIDPVKTPRLERPIGATIRISAESVRDHLERLAPGGLSGFDVSMEDDVLTVTATARVVVPIRATGACSLLLAGKAISVQIISVSPSAARGIVEKQIAALNPVVDLSHLPFNFCPSAIAVHRGYTDITGTLTV